MTPQELINKGALWAMYNPLGKIALAKVYAEMFGKSIMPTPEKYYKAFFEIKDQLNKL